MECVEQLLTANEIAEHLGVCVTTVTRMEKKGRFPPSIRVGFGKQTRRWRLSDFDTWLKSLAKPYEANNESI